REQIGVGHRVFVAGNELVAVEQLLESIETTPDHAQLDLLHFRPAFVAYDQFLSTGILQPLSRVEVWGQTRSFGVTPTSGPQRLIMACRLIALAGCEASQQRSPYSITSSARGEQRRRHFQANRLRHDQVNDEVELGRLLDRKIGGLRPPPQILSTKSPAR